MRITEVRIQNFKRFTDLSIEGIPASAKLVLLIGSNGSGKSSVFDAFDYMSKPDKDGETERDSYYLKKEDLHPLINFGISEEIGKDTEPIKFIGRSSMRIVPRITMSGLDFEKDILAKDKDAPRSLIDFDSRFNFDATKYIRDVNRALREPIFRGEQADTVKIFQDFIEPLNNALKNIFGDDEKTVIQISQFEDADIDSPPNLIFTKGKSKIGYDLLSQGEKQVVITLLNFIVRKEQLENSIYFIDEMDAHLNTAIQYTLLKEITENWIPDTCQLWTASHSLGFIDYARHAADAAIIDFDQLNFDLPQILTPEPKDNLEVYEIAVGKDILSRIFQGMEIVFAENTDATIYNLLAIDKTIFVPENNKNAVFHKVRNGEFKGLIDRDFLTETEIKALEKFYQNLKILRFYSIENYLLHPDNLEEYFNQEQKAFDKNAYIEALIKAKNSVKDNFVYSLVPNRMSYPFYREMSNKSPKSFKNTSENQAAAKEIYQSLNSDKLEDFYPLFPMKDYGKTIPHRQNLQYSELSTTQWFKQQIKAILD